MPIPKYEFIKQDLIKELKEHIFMPGDRFYSEAEVKQRYQVSSITAVKALNELTNAGYLFRVQGKGTFVSKAKVGKVVKFSDIEKHALDHESVAVLEIVKDNNPEILKELQLGENESYYRITRVRTTDGIPFLLHITHLPLSLVATPLKEKSAFNSIYERIYKDFKIDMYTLASSETNEIIFPEDPKILNALQLSFREPVVLQQKHSFLASGAVAEYVVSFKHWRYFKTKVDVEAE